MPLLGQKDKNSSMTANGEKVRRARMAAGLSQVELARRARVSRQALGAIESGEYQPSVAVALRIARELGESVESLFGDGADPGIEADWAGEGPPPARARVALGRVNGRVVALPQPVSALSLAPAAGIVESEGGSGKRVAVEAFRSQVEIDSTVLLAGCDPAAAILSDWLVRRRAPARVVALQCSSGAALRALVERRVHAAGMHIRDARTGEYNIAFARRILGNRRAVFVNFASWEIGLAVPMALRDRIRDVADLARQGVRMVNRERGSGARLALDEALAQLGVEARSLKGYERELGGHLEVAAAVGSGEAQAGVTIRVAAEAYGLHFIPMREERYDLLIPEREMEFPAVGAMLEALNTASFARELSALCGYDTSRTGTIIASGARIATHD